MKKRYSIISKIILAVLGVANIVLLFSMIGSISTYNNMNKQIEEKYPSEIRNNKVYVESNIVTANILGYEDGMCKTDLGDIPCEKSSGTVIVLFHDILGELRPIVEINKYPEIEYVTSDFVKPPNSIILSNVVDKGEYSDYLKDLKILGNYGSEVSKHKNIVMFSMIILILDALVHIAIFVIPEAKKLAKAKIKDKQPELSDDIETSMDNVDKVKNNKETLESPDDFGIGELL